MLLFPFALFLNGLNKKYSEGFQKDIREYTDFGGGEINDLLPKPELPKNFKKLAI